MVQISSLRSRLTVATATLFFAFTGCSEQVVVTPFEVQPTPSPTPQPQGKSVVCSFSASSDPSRTALAWIRGTDLVFTRADGSSFVAHTFPKVTSKDPSSEPSITLVARDGFVAAKATSMGFSATGESQLVSEALLLDRSGKVLWSETWTDGIVNPIFLGDGGALAVGLNVSGPGSMTFVVGPAGEVAKTEGALPIAAPTKGGRVAVQLDNNMYAPPVYGWFDSASTTMGSFAYPTDQSVYLTAIDSGSVVFLLPDKEGSLLVSEGDGTTAFPLASSGAFLGVTAPHGFTMIHEAAADVSSRHWRALPGQAPAPITMPTELGLFGWMYYEGPSVGDLGEVLATMSDDSSGGLFRSLDLGATWELIGDRFVNIASIPFVARGGTYVIAAIEEGGYYPSAPWFDVSAGGTPPGHVGPATELVRPDDGILRMLPSTANQFTLSDEGACLAYQDGGHLLASEVATGKSIDLGEGVATQGDNIVWLP